jgi:hypothetical protein
MWSKGSWKDTCSNGSWRHRATERSKLSSRYGRSAVLIAMSTATLLTIDGMALAASAGPVVRPHGTVAGKGYSYFLGKSWRVIFAAPAHHANRCATTTVGGKQVAVIWSKAVLGGSGVYRQTCTEPAGRPIFLQHVNDECSTFKGDHGDFGTTGAQLKKCARVQFANSTATTKVDGHKLAHQVRYLAATHVYAINLHKSNYFGYKERHGRSAARGYGVLLRGFAAGTHKVVVVGRIPKFKFHFKQTYTIKVR